MAKEAAATGASTREDPSRRAMERRLRGWSFALALGVALDGALGLAALVTVGFGRATSWLPRPGRDVYVVHALVGAALGVGALVLAIGARALPRVPRVCARVGFVGVGVGALGGVLADVRALRLGGAALMFVGVGAAFLAYLTAALATPAGDEEHGGSDIVGAD